MASPLKWFPFYVDDWETDEKIRRLTFEERGVYLAMLCWQWREGSLPARHGNVTKALGARPSVVTKLYGWFFVTDGPSSDRVVNRRLEQVRADQVHRLEANAEKAKAYRERMRVRHGDVTEESPHRSRSILSRIAKESLGSREPGT